MQAIKETAQQTQYLTFFIAGEEYAIGILQIREIIEYNAITKVPTTPIWIRGVINLRGGVVPVVDLAVKFGLAETTITKRTCIIIVEVDLEGERTVMGIIADSVNQVIDLKPDDIEPTPSFGTRIRVDYLIGMGKVENKFVLILDIDQVLSANELLTLVELQEPEAEAGKFVEREIDSRKEE
jgi:purine-binding chemotaxis protein CheW